jgi:hypothetical protein
LLFLRELLDDRVHAFVNCLLYNHMTLNASDSVKIITHFNQGDVDSVPCWEQDTRMRAISLPLARIGATM